MQAIILKQPAGLEQLALTGIEPVAPMAGEIRIRNHASSLNFHDYAVVVGLIPTVHGRIPMSDGAGIVEAVGPDVSEFKVGDRVMSCFFPYWQDGRADSVAKLQDVPGDMSHGFAAQVVTKPATAFTRIPAAYSFEQAATLPCAALTAWRALMVEARVKPGDTVLVQGSGGVSVFALQFAKSAGCQVIATSSSDEKLERLEQLGADKLINYKQHPDWGERVLQLTDGVGVDVVIEIGGAGTVPQSIRAVRMGGHISLIGVLSGISGEIPTAALLQKNAVLSGITVGSRAQQLDMINAIEACGIVPEIDSSFPLAEIADAFRRQESQQHFGKICLNI